MKCPKRSQYKYAKSPYRIRNWPDKRSGSSQFTAWYRTSSGWGGIYCGQRTTGCCTAGPSTYGLK